MKPRKLKSNVPRTAKEWLEYQEYRDRWTPEMQSVLDKSLRDASPVTVEDRKAGKSIREHLLTSHRKKSS